jgi:hypothetical protein
MLNFVDTLQSLALILLCVANIITWVTIRRVIDLHKTQDEINQGFLDLLRKIRLIITGKEEKVIHD